jgi:hypothetical protein
VELWQVHFAHLERPDGKRTPVEVLGWVHGRYVPIPTLSQIFELIYVFLKGSGLFDPFPEEVRAVNEPVQPC